VKNIVIDNFLPYPNVVRSWALSQRFYNCEDYSFIIGHDTSWPGTRTQHVMDLDSDYANVTLGQFSQLLGRHFSEGSMSIKSYFQSCLKDDGDSWVHQDNDVDIAAVLYLTPNAPISSGTSTYRCKNIEKWSRLNIDDMKKINSQEKVELYENLFERVDYFGNVFNRIIIYPGTTFHKSNEYFGNSKENGRLTQVFFAKFEK
jgi:hypothetical protein